MNIITQIKLKRKLYIFKRKLDECIALAEKELLERMNKNFGESTEEQLKEVIIPELDKLKKQLENGELKVKCSGYLQSFAYAFKDWCWDMQNPTELYRCITALNELYKEIGNIK